MAEQHTNQQAAPVARPATRQQWHLELDASGAPPLSQVATGSGLSKQALKRAMRQGAVWAGHGNQVQRWRRVDKALPPGTQIHVYYDPHILSQTPPSPTLIADEQSYSVWYKPYGLASQGSKWGDHFAIDRWINQHLEPQRPAFIVHRLDRAASGLMLIAHRKRSAAALSAQFQQRSVEKRYQALVRGRFQEDETVRIDQPIDGRHASSQVTLAHYFADQDLSLLNVLIETGRKHQIRRHLAGIGFAIVGDRLYGQADSGAADLQLCAWQLVVHCPVEQRRKCFTLPEQYRLHTPYPYPDSNSPTGHGSR